MQRGRRILPRVALTFLSALPRPLIAALAASAFACAQAISFGVVGGASVTEDFRNSYQYVPPPGPNITLTDYSTPERYIVGGMLEFQLPENWSVEVDGLYHPLRYNAAFISQDGTLYSVSPSPVITWEFPILAQYRFHWRAWRPFLEVGPSFRTAGNLNSANPSHYGVAVGAGAETHFGKFGIAPEIRYIRWAQDNPQFVQTRPDQLELLTSFRTGAFENGRTLTSRISVGVVLGATLTPDYNSFQATYTSIPATVTYTDSYVSGPTDLLLGAMVEVALAKGFFLEGDAIHQPMSTTIRERSSDGSTSSGSVTETTIWAFPVLGKYKFDKFFAHRVRPFLEAGPSFRDATELEGSSPYGVTAGAGIEVHFWRVAVSPSLRYTHWGRNSLILEGGLQPLRNQAEVLAGFTF